MPSAEQPDRPTLGGTPVLPVPGNKVPLKVVPFAPEIQSARSTGEVQKRIPHIGYLIYDRGVPRGSGSRGSAGRRRRRRVPAGRRRRRPSPVGGLAILY